MPDEIDDELKSDIAKIENQIEQNFPGIPRDAAHEAAEDEAAHSVPAPSSAEVEAERLSRIRPAAPN